MREIKFRVWDKENKTMYFPNETENMFLSLGNDYFEIQDHSTENYQANSNDLSIVNSLDDDLKLMQHTGLKDKNGKCIYEGDILHFKTSKKTGHPFEGVNVYYEVRFGRYNTTDNTLHASQGFYTFRRDSENSLEFVINSLKAVVIGNIHENPELL